MTTPVSACQPRAGNKSNDSAAVSSVIPRNSQLMPIHRAKSTIDSNLSRNRKTPQHHRHGPGENSKHSHRRTGVGAESGEHISDAGHHQVDAEQDTYDHQCLVWPNQHRDTQYHCQRCR